MPRILSAAALIVLAALTPCRAVGAVAKPNVILIMTDDQGYGDIAAHGNTMIQTPAMDKLFTESVRLVNYHVDPTCSPTRSALMSGRYSTRTGVWHTIMGRSLMNASEVTMAEMFAAAGYATGMYGKWHLGDNYPLRAIDQGFGDVVCHHGGGVGQGPDYWGNDYFDDTYWRNGKPEKFEGYCTDVWFREATRFIRENKDRPFFCYLATNAPHGPYLVSEKYWKPYAEKGVPDAMAHFYGMITNINENMTRLRQELETLGLAENTILIFTTDNGTAAGVARSGKQGKGKKAGNADGWTGFTAGMRGQKGSEYEGGHRVPFYIHWPAGKLGGGRDVDQLCAHVDVLPTLADLCGITRPDGPPLDGTSLKAALYGDKNVLRDRTLFVHSQRIENPEKWRKCSVMSGHWRLVDGKELYDIESDPGQTRNVASENAPLVEKMRDAYEGWWKSLEPMFPEYVRIGLGSDKDNPAHLMSHDWHTNNKACPWNQGAVRSGTIANGPWAVDVLEDGKYEITLLRWPRQENKAMGCKAAKFKLGNVELAQEIEPAATTATFTTELKRGPTMLETWLTREDGKQHGAYFVEVRRLK